MLVTVSAELPIDAATYLLERDGAAFRSFIAEEMNLLEYEIERCWRDGSATKIMLSSKPDVSAWIPGTLANKIPESLAYHDEARTGGRDELLWRVTYRPEELQQPPFTFSITSECPALGHKGHFTSRTRIESAGPNRCLHILEQTIEFKGLWGLGGVAKKMAKKSLESTFNDMPGIIEKWVQLRQELLQTPHGRERLLAGRPRVEGVAWMDEAVAAIKQAGSTGRPRHHRKSATGGVSAAGLAPVKPAVEGAILALHTPFAAAAGTSAASPGVQGEQFAAGPAPWAPAVQAEAGNGSEFVDARQRQYVRQDTVGTVYLTPNASPATSFDAEPARMGAPGGAAPSGRAQQQQAAQAEAGAGAEAEGPASAHEGSSRYSTSGDESQGSEEDVEAEWGKVAPWRAYYLQRGLTPSRASRQLPDDLVEYFVSGRRPQPVKAERLGGRGPGLGGTRGPLRRLLASCAGRHSTAAD